jgi:RNA polymerase sigma-70 factor (ECF subfamily)
VIDQPSTPHDREIDPARWLEEHGDALYAFAMSRLRNPAQAEDAVQETFLAAMKGKERFSGRSSERTWLIGILKHKIIDYFRKHGREQTYEDTETLEAFEREHFREDGHWRAAPGSLGMEPSKLVENREFWEVLHACVGGLKPAHRDVFTLREMDGRDGGDICAVLGISPSNLWVTLYRARMQLRTCLQKNWFGGRAQEARP